MPYTFTRTGAKIEEIHNTVDNLPNIVSNDNLVSNSSFEVAGSVTNPPDSTPRNYSPGDELFQGFKAVAALTGVTYTNGVLGGTGQLYVDVVKTNKMQQSTAGVIASVSGADGEPITTGVNFIDNTASYRVTFDIAGVFSVKLEAGSVATRHLVQEEDAGELNTLRPRDFGANPNADSTAAIQSMFNAITVGSKIVWDATYPVTQVSIIGKTDFAFSGIGGLIGTHTDKLNPLEFVFEMQNCTSFCDNSVFFVSGAGTIAYSYGVKVWSGVGLTSSLLQPKFRILNVPSGWLFGDLTAPDQLLSEIVVSEGYMFNVPRPLTIIGSQAVIEFNGYQLISAGVGELASESHAIATMIGGVLHVNGGECQLPGVTSGYGFDIRPINSPGFNNTYGNVFLNGTALECASLWALFNNPASVTVEPSTGGIRFTQVSGFASFPGEVIQSVLDFTGHIFLDASNKFFASAVRTVKTIGCDGDATVTLGEGWSEGTFVEGIQGVRGGIVNFPTQEILSAANLSGQAFPPGQTDMIFQSVPSTVKNSRFSGAYNPSTGVFTVPDGGLKDVTISVQFNAVTANPNSELYAIINGSLPEGLAGMNSKFINSTFRVGDLDGGNTVVLRVANLDPAWTAVTSNYDKFVISARR